MSRPYFPFPQSAGPIPVDGGIRARSKRGAIGEQWWSRRFIAVLETLGMSGRLQRGRNYARKGQVLEFSLTQGKVTAQVQGSRPKPYRVTISVLPLTSPAVAGGRAQAGQPGAVPREAAGRRNASGNRTGLRRLRHASIPRSAADLDMHCSCPDWEVPCKHLAAVCYVLAEAFDDDPFAMLAWRGRNRDTLLAALRRAGPPPAAGSPETGGRGRAEADAPAVPLGATDAQRHARRAGRRNRAAARSGR